MENSGLRYQAKAMEAIVQTPTPFYYYDMGLLDATLQIIKRQIEGYPYHVHYAIKANGNPKILSMIAREGFGADLVSGHEVEAAIKAGFDPTMLTFSGVGKTDWEIRVGLTHAIGCFNVESTAELDVIDELAREMDTTAQVAFRVNPDIDAHTHKFITTGTAANKFGIGIEALEPVINHALQLQHIHVKGLHFHIGSQITQMEPYVMLCNTVNTLQEHYRQRGITFEMINVGGGLGIDYDLPDEHPLPDFKTFFDQFKRHLRLSPGQLLHFELGRSIVGGCGSLISRVVFVKESRDKKFVILDAGMTDLIRPALYQARHVVQNLTAAVEGRGETDTYDIVGPVCESSDVFVHGCTLPVTRRGDLIAIRSAGAYGESMASCYNMRALPGCLFHFPE